MSREILFKGWCPRNEKWIEGDVIFQNKNTVIRRRSDAMCFEADPPTVCQYTGLKDASGSKIWENDIILVKESSNSDVGIVRYGEYGYICGGTDFHVGFYVNWQNNNAMWRNDLGYWAKDYSICGNTFDNPELLEGGAGEDD